MITPFTQAGEVDHQKAWDLARHLAANGTDTLVVAGTTGESPTLSDAEKLALFKTVVDSVAEKKTKVMAGTGTYDTAHSVEMTQKAAELGVDAVLAVTPYYNKPTPDGLVGHFTAVADVDLGIFDSAGSGITLSDIPLANFSTDKTFEEVLADVSSLIISFEMVDNNSTQVSETNGVDNVMLVPEPTSLALLGIGGLLAARRRR